MDTVQITRPLPGVLPQPCAHTESYVCKSKRNLRLTPLLNGWAAKGSVLKVELDGSRIVLSKHVDDAISRVRGKFALDVPAGNGKA